MASQRHRPRMSNLVGPCAILLEPMPKVASGSFKNVPRRLNRTQVNTDYRGFRMLAESFVSMNRITARCLCTHSAISIAQMPVPVPRSRTLLSFFGSFTTCSSPSSNKLTPWWNISSLNNKVSYRAAIQISFNRLPLLLALFVAQTT